MTKRDLDLTDLGIEYETWSDELYARMIAEADAAIEADERTRGVECSTYRRYSVGDALFNPFS